MNTSHELKAKQLAFPSHLPGEVYRLRPDLLVLVPQEGVGGGEQVGEAVQHHGREGGGAVAGEDRQLGKRGRRYSKMKCNITEHTR